MPYKDLETRRLKARAYCQAWRLRNPGYRSATYGKKYGYKTREAARAHTAVYDAIRAGILVRPLRCDWCGAGGFIEAAHRDYSKRLEVDWLCRHCHREHDAAYPKNGLQKERPTEPKLPTSVKRVTQEQARARRAAWAREDRRKKRLVRTGPIR